MLLVAPVREDIRRQMTEEETNWFGLKKLNVVRSSIPAVTHVDYSARLQSVAREDNQRYYDIIDAFRKKNGCAVVINTSFNVRGEPIVCSPHDAYMCFMRTEMDYLIMGELPRRQDRAEAARRTTSTGATSSNWTSHERSPLPTGARDGGMALWRASQAGWLSSEKR